MKEVLIKQLSRTVGNTEKAEIKEWMEQNNVPLNLLFELVMYKTDPKVAFRAAWIFEEIVLSDFSKIEPLLIDFLTILPSVNNRSVHRHFSKILCKLLEAKAKQKLNPTLLEKLQIFDFENIIEALFVWLIDAKEKVGVKVWCIEALYYLSLRYAWISEELELQIIYLSEKSSSGFLPRGKKIRKFLKNMYDDKR